MPAFLASPAITEMRLMDNSSVDKMIAWFRDDTNQWKKFLAEICVYLDLGHHLVSACYKLEGDGPLILYGYDLLTAVEVSLRSQYAAMGTRAQALSPLSRRMNQCL